MAGSGLQVDAIQSFVEKTGVREVHFGSGVRENLDALAEVSEEKMTKLVKILKR